MSRNHWRTILLYLSLPLVVTGCATRESIKSTNSNAPVRRVNFSKAPELKAFAERARDFGNAMYPKICALLLDDTARPPRQFDLIFAPMKSQNTGEAHLEVRRIYINSDYLTNSPDLQDRFEKVFVHEMAHMATQFRRNPWAFWKSEPAANKYWGESIADYAFYKLIGTNGWGCPECNLRFPHYTSGYTCGGAFLLFLEDKHGTNVVRQLVATLGKRTYSDSFFTNATDRSLEVAWADFQQTSVFKPGAKRVFELQQALGYVNGQPPKNVEKRFKKLLDQHADVWIKRAMNSIDPIEKPARPLSSRMALYLYFTQPGGTPEQLLSNLRERGELPGFAKGEKGWLSTIIKYDVMERRTFPMSQTLTGRKTNDTSRYHYTVACPAENAGWNLQKAWRTALDGKVVEEFPLP